MRVYLLRHGTAEERPAGGKDDRDRALVKKGRQQCRQVAALLRRLGVKPEVVLTSPLLRARQTAEAVARGMSLSVVPVEEPRLAPGGSATEALKAVVNRRYLQGPILAVGHEPLLSEMAAALLGTPDLRLELRKGGLIEMEIYSRRPLRGALLGLVRPGYAKE
jgi:phosphohistidine phosphatase